MSNNKKSNCKNKKHQNLLWYSSFYDGFGLLLDYTLARIIHQINQTTFI